MSSTVSPGNQVASLPLHAGLCRGGPYTSLADRGNNMERNDLNKSMCEELKQLRKDTEYTEGWAESFEHQLGRVFGREV